MDFRQLQYIQAVAEHRSVTRAANALYISQPSLSHFIAKTEEELGVQLFNRTTNPISLTYAGEQYLKTAHEILRLSDQMSKQIRDISQNIKGRINVGMPHERAAYMLPILLPEYHKIYPGIEINVFEGKSDSLLDNVEKGRTDMAILPLHIKDNNLLVESIYEEELFLVADEHTIRPEHLNEDRPDAVDLEKLADVPFVLLKKGHGIRTAVDRLFKAHRIKPQIIMETTSNLTAYRLATAGIGAAIVPDMTVRLVQSAGRPRQYALTSKSVTWNIVATYRNDAYIGVAEKAFLDMARDIFTNRRFTLE